MSNSESNNFEVPTPQDDAAEEVRRHERQTLAGSYLGDAVRELRGSGSADELYPNYGDEQGQASASQGVIAARIAEGRRRRATRRAVLFAALAAEAYVNQFLQIHLSDPEFKAADKLPTFEKYMLGPQLALGRPLFQRGREPSQSLKRLLKERNALVHPKLAEREGELPGYTPLEAATFIVSVADAATWLHANADPRPRIDPTAIVVDGERDYFLEFARQATKRLPAASDPPAPDLVFEIWARWIAEYKEKGEIGASD